jgi:hypothetical protein
MTPSTPVDDLAAQWKSARQLYPIYLELAREFAIEVKPFAELESGADVPGKETVEQAKHWMEEMDQHIQVHQLRQFLQTTSSVNQEGLLALVQHFLTHPLKSDAMRDKIDFLLVQYFSQLAPTGVGDAEVDLAYVERSLQPVLGEVDLKPPVWLNSLDRVLETARRCRSLDELLHGGVLEQGRKAKGLAGDLFYLPVALVAFTRFGYLMRRVFFRLMLGDLNTILEGLTELEDKGIVTIDCRRAQFSEKEPIVRLRMICQSWKVMFQAEYSSGQPLRMLVDLRASVNQALGRGEINEAQAKSKPKSTTEAKSGMKPAGAANVGSAKEKAVASAATAGATKSLGTFAVSAAAAKPVDEASAAGSEPPEFEISNAPGWDPDSESQADQKS